MRKLVGAYIYKMDGVNAAVVTDKSIIINGKEEDFEPVTLIVTEEQVREWFDELDFVSEEEREEIEV